MDTIRQKKAKFVINNMGKEATACMDDYDVVNCIIAGFDTRDFSVIIGFDHEDGWDFTSKNDYIHVECKSYAYIEIDSLTIVE